MPSDTPDQPEAKPTSPEDLQRLKHQAVRGGAWTAAATAYATLVQLAAFLVLYRLLPPADFGLMEIVTIVGALATVFADAGLSNAIIWRQDLTRRQLSSLYWLSAGCGLVLAVVVLAVGPLAAWAYGRGELVGLLAAFSVTMLLVGAGQQFSVLLRREMLFRRLGLVNAGSATVGAAVAVVLAVAGLGVWSLVWGAVARELTRLVVSVAMTPRAWWPQWRFRRSDLAGVIGFSLYQVGGRSLAAVRNELDRLIVGAFVSASILGCYGAVRRWVLFPLAKLNPVISTVAFPAFARVQDDDAMMRGYLKVIRYVAALAAPLLAGLFVTAPVFVEVVYGPNFHQHAPLMVTLVRILCLLGLTRALSGPLGSVILAKGRADVSFWLSVVRIVVSLGGLLIGVVWGVVGVAWSQVAVAIVVTGIGFGMASRVVRLSARPWVAAASPVAVAVAMGAGVWGLGLVLPTMAPIWRLACQAGAGVILYAVLARILYPTLVSEVRNSLAPPPAN